MGCDIHLYSETKRDGKWVADKADTFKSIQEGDYTYIEMEPSYSGRNYFLFGLLCKDVRTGWEWSFEQRGVPEDVSTEIAQNITQYDNDGHSHSWLTVPELKAKATELLLSNTSEAFELCDYLKELIDGLPQVEDPTQQRVVFFFDN